jgi:hypothetical protein
MISLDSTMSGHKTLVYSATHVLLQNYEQDLPHQQRKSASHPMCQKDMSALGRELPLDAICVNGSFAQIVTFAKPHMSRLQLARVLLRVFSH